MNKPFVVTVSQLNRRISLMLKGEKAFSDIYIKGEILNLKNHYKSGHIYFSLKDELSSLKVVMFSSNASELTFEPEDGMAVIVRGSVQCYEKEGQYQLYASEIFPEGIGVQAAALQQLKNKLEKEGIFSQKRSLPEFPEKICVITSESGAALQDIINIISRRYPIAKIHVISVLVQGEKAPESIVNAFIKSGKTGADLIIFGRGGGSAEDLSAFNNENVVRAVFNSSIPTISAVGHETDFSLSDFAADLRVPTPSAAAEIAVPDVKELIYNIDNISQRIKARFFDIIDYYSKSVDIISNRIQLKNPLFTLSVNEQLTDSKFIEITDKFTAFISAKEHELSETASVINALNPISVLMRGYSIVYKNDKVVFSENDVAKGDKIKVRVNDGTINATVE